MRFREFAISQNIDSMATKENLIAWLQEQAETGDLSCADNKSALRLVFTLAQRDTTQCLHQLQKRASQIESALLDDVIVGESLDLWRRWLNKSQTILVEIEKELTTYLDKWSCEVRKVPSPTQRWTSRFLAYQEPHVNPVSMFFRGLAPEQELFETRKMLQLVSREINGTRSTIEHTTSSLRTTMSLIESRRAISEAESVTKLTELAFLFIPLSFAASFFSMPLDVRLYLFRFP